MQTEENKQDAYEHKLKNETPTTITDILNDGWKGVGKSKFKSADDKKTLYFDHSSGQCRIV